MKTAIVSFDHNVGKHIYPCVKRYTGSFNKKGSLIVWFTGPEMGTCLIDFEEHVGGANRAGQYRSDWLSAECGDWAFWDGTMSFKN